MSPKRQKEPSPEEAFAERVVVHTFGDQVVMRDNNSCPRMVDFILHAADDSLIAVEVTTLTLRRQEAIRAALVRLCGPKKELNRTWIIRLLHNRQIKDTQPQIVDLLRDLEGDHIDRIYARSDQNETRISDRARDAGIIEAYSVVGPGGIFVSNRSIGSGCASGDILSEITTDVMRDQRRDDNAKKLRETGLAHRHLFIVVKRAAGATWYKAEQALRSQLLPQIPPVADEVYTGVWVAAEEARLIVYWTRELGWNYTEISQVHAVSP